MRAARHLPLLIVPALAALIGWLALPVSADAYASFIDFDAQGPDGALDEYVFDVLSVYTSGLGWAQLLVLVAGAHLARGCPGTTRGVVGRVAVAAAFGALTAGAVLAVVLPAAPGVLADHPALTQAAYWDAPIAPADVPSTAQLALVVGCGISQVCAFGVAGAALAVWSRRRWVSMVVVALPGLSAAVIVTTRTELMSALPPAAAPVLAVLTYVAGLLALPWGLLWFFTLSSAAPLAAAATWAVALALTAAALRRTARSRPAVADPPCPSTTTSA